MKINTAIRHAAVVATLGILTLIAACEMENNNELEEGLDIATASQTIGTPEVHITETITKNGAYSAESRFDWIGRDCTDGYRRTTTDTNPTVRKLWNGWCRFVGWENPSDVTNCKGLFETKSAPYWGNARCSFTIYEEELEPNGHWDYCKFFGPCGDGEGDCDTHDECAVGLICQSDIGAEYGWNPGVDVCISPDLITINKAEYKVSKSELKVEATSSDGGNVTLTVVGYGQMDWDSKKKKYKYKEKSATDPGATIVVRSDRGGQATVQVTRK